MVIERYAYSCANDTAGGSCDPYTLRTEIDGNPAIGQSVHAVSVEGDTLAVYMSAALTEGEDSERAELDATVGLHTGVPLQRSLRIGDHLDTPAVLWDPPLALNYATGLATRLRKAETFVQGELRTIAYHPDATVDLATGAITFVGAPVVREDFAYVRDAAGFAKSRTQTITWLRKDGSDHPTQKVMGKVYNPGASMREGKRRRRNIIDQVELRVAQLLLETELANQGGDVQGTLELGRDLASHYGKEISDFENLSKQSILTAIQNDQQFAWLDNLPPSLGGAITIRDEVIAELDIWGIT